ncbi:hypothetical protein AMELA_G00266530 [Ameiurus melas]|uniref:tRNA-uridine aminocarboxypropyltransferase 1 n=1 Tax=Ameiurus melas TaxID=219545 RepID=A0A7J5ZM54_AMEME|nr:hypothetical protein AMELA_G00266530 [Ameiurus melas]
MKSQLIEQLQLSAGCLVTVRTLRINTSCVNYECFRCIADTVITRSLKLRKVFAYKNYITDFAAFIRYLRVCVISLKGEGDVSHRTGHTGPWLKCPTCGSSRLLYCYSCCCLVGLNPHLIPKVELPVKIDIIKHPNETDGKSTAVHAKLIAPDHVSIYTYPCIPELNTHNVVLVFPGPDSMTVQELADYIKNTEHTQEDTRPVQRVIFIDSTWNQTTKIISDERLQDLPRVELKSRKTCFWRHQRGSPDTYLATIEAIYYFLKEFHVHCLGREYRGEYDNLLFFYTFLHKLIRKAKQGRV